MFGIDPVAWEVAKPLLVQLAIVAVLAVGVLAMCIFSGEE